MTLEPVVLVLAAAVLGTASAIFVSEYRRRKTWKVDADETSYYSSRVEDVSRTYAQHGFDAFLYDVNSSFPKEVLCKTPEAIVEDDYCLIIDEDGNEERTAVADLSEIANAMKGDRGPGGKKK